MLTEEQSVPSKAAKKRKGVLRIAQGSLARDSIIDGIFAANRYCIIDRRSFTSLRIM